MTDAHDHDDSASQGLAHAAREAEIEALQRTVQRLCGALDALLPIARSHMAVTAAAGGPADEAFVPDPDNPNERVLPQILEAEEMLHAADRSGAEATGGGFESIDPEDFLDDINEATDEARTAHPETLEAALFAAARLAEALNAHRIASLEADEDLRSRYRDALIVLADRLADNLTAS